MVRSLICYPEHLWERCCFLTLVNNRGWKQNEKGTVVYTLSWISPRSATSSKKRISGVSMYVKKRCLVIFSMCSSSWIHSLGAPFLPASLEQATESGRTPQFWGQVKLNKGPGLRVSPNIQSTPRPPHVSPETLTESRQVWVNTNWVSWHRNVGKRWAAGFGLPSESNTTNSWPRSVLFGRKRSRVLCDVPEGKVGDKPGRPRSHHCPLVYQHIRLGTQGPSIDVVLAPNNGSQRGHLYNRETSRPHLQD